MHRNISLNVNGGMRVLEIGAGGSPHPLTSLIVERFIDEPGSFEQRGHRGLAIDRPFVKADACALPLAGGSFDYVLASHVLEHIPHDGLDCFLTEMSRVAKAGYIETPSLLFECLLDVPQHRWMVYCKSGVIHLCPKKPDDVSPLRRFFRPMFQKDPAFWKNNIIRYSELWMTGIEWKDKIKFVVHEQLPDLIALYEDSSIQECVLAAASQPVAARFAHRLALFADQAALKLRRTLLTNSPPRIEVPWRTVIACPACHGSLKEQNGWLLCPHSCGRFPILSGDIPSFVEHKELL